MARDTITLSFKKENKDVYNILQGLDEQIIDYICRLVREDQSPRKDMLQEVLEKLEVIDHKLDSKTFQEKKANEDIWEVDSETEDWILNEED